MKAIGLHQYGGPEVLQTVELPTPHPTAGQVRVKVLAAGINPVDEMLRSGDLAGWYSDTPRPYIPGMDMAGIIDEIGTDVDAALGVSVGQLVVGIVDNFGSYGAYSEYVCLPARSVMPVPANASLPEAGSLLLNALTARNALDNLDLPQGSTLLVTGAAGAVGAYAVALAKADGFAPIAVSAAADEAFLLEQGAVAVIPRGEQLAARIRERFPDGVDAVVDAACILPQILPAVRDGGTLIVLRPAEDQTLERGIRTKFVNVRDRSTDHETIARIGQQVAAGLLPLRVAAIFPAREAVTAHRMRDAGGLRGRIVLDFEHSGL